METNNKGACLGMVGLAVLFNLVFIYLEHTIAFQSFLAPLIKIPPNLIPFMLEIVFSSAITLIVYFLCTKIWVSLIIVHVVSTLLALVSFFKEAINGMPLLLSDFDFAQNLNELVGFSLDNLSFSHINLIVVVLEIALFVLAAMLERKLPKPALKIRLISLLASIAVVILAFIPQTFKLCANSIDRHTYGEDRVGSYGVNMGLYFTQAYNTSLNSPPTKKDIMNVKAEVKKAAKNKKGTDVGVTPNVIFVMSEGFFDISKLPFVEFSVDPCPNFHKLCKEGTAGKFLSTTYSGGTGYVEAEVLTGICSNLLKGSDTLTSFKDKRQYNRIPVITDVFKNYGYTTTFLHSYNSSLYNRKNMYEGFKFDNIYFEDSFPEDVTRYNELISDKDLTQKIISLLEGKDDNPMFMYAVSMENHYPYFAGKYPPDARVSVSSPKLSEEELTVLDCCTDGIYGADVALGELVKYIKEQDEPYMLIFFGDHRPNLTASNSKSVYSSLGIVSSDKTASWETEELYEMMQTDYVIWTNYEENKDYPDKKEGCTFLGLDVLKRLGFELTEYYTYLDTRIAKDTLLLRPKLYVSAEGKASKSVPRSYLDRIKEFRTAVRNIVYGDNSVFGIER